MPEKLPSKNQSAVRVKINSIPLSVYRIPYFIVTQLLAAGAGNHKYIPNIRYAGHRVTIEPHRIPESTSCASNRSSNSHFALATHLPRPVRAALSRDNFALAAATYTLNGPVDRLSRAFTPLLPCTTLLGARYCTGIANPSLAVSRPSVVLRGIELHRISSSSLCG